MIFFLLKILENSTSNSKNQRILNQFQILTYFKLYDFYFTPFEVSILFTIYIKDFYFHLHYFFHLPHRNTFSSAIPFSLRTSLLRDIKRKTTKRNYDINSIFCLSEEHKILSCMPTCLIENFQSQHNMLIREKNMEQSNHCIMS